MHFWVFLSALQCDAGGRYSRGRLIEEAGERGRARGREGGTQRGEGEKMLLRWTLGTFLRTVYGFLLIFRLFYQRTEDHVSVHKPLVSFWKGWRRQMNEKGYVVTRIWLAGTPPQLIYSICASAMCVSSFSATFTNMNFKHRDVEIRLRRKGDRNHEITRLMTGLYSSFWLILYQQSFN